MTGWIRTRMLSTRLPCRVIFVPIALNCGIGVHLGRSRSPSKGGNTRAPHSPTEVSAGSQSDNYGWKPSGQSVPEITSTLGAARRRDHAQRDTAATRSARPSSSPACAAGDTASSQQA